MSKQSLVSIPREGRDEIGLWSNVFTAGYQEALRIPMPLADSLQKTILGCAIAADLAVLELRKRLQEPEPTP